MKNNYEVSEISLEDTESLIQKEHYLKDIYGKDHPYPQSIIHDCFGLFNQNKLVGAVQFCSYVPSPNPRYHEWVKDFFGCHTDTCEGFYEIARLAVEPQDEHNITSYSFIFKSNISHFLIIFFIFNSEYFNSLYH